MTSWEELCVYIHKLEADVIIVSPVRMYSGGGGTMV